MCVCVLSHVSCLVCRRGIQCEGPLLRGLRGTLVIGAPGDTALRRDLTPQHQPASRGRCALSLGLPTIAGPRVLAERRGTHEEEDDPRWGGTPGRLALKTSPSRGQVARAPIVWRLGHGREAPVCGGPTSQCSLTPCPGPLTPLPRLIARSGTPLSPRVSALPPLCSQGPRRGWFLYTTSLYDGNILPHGGISIAPRPHQGHPWAGPCPHARHGIPHDFPLLARASRPSTG